MSLWLATTVSVQNWVSFDCRAGCSECDALILHFLLHGHATPLHTLLSVDRALAAVLVSTSAP